jgi:hypothetical protein
LAEFPEAIRAVLQASHAPSSTGERYWSSRRRILGESHLE